MNIHVYSKRSNSKSFYLLKQKFAVYLSKSIFFEAMLCSTFSYLIYCEAINPIYYVEYKTNNKTIFTQN